MSNRARQSIDDGSMTAVWAVVDNGKCLETPPDNGGAQTKGGLAAGQKTTRRLAGLSRMMAALVIRRGVWDLAAV